MPHFLLGARSPRHRAAQRPAPLRPKSAVAGVFSRCEIALGIVWPGVIVVVSPSREGKPTTKSFDKSCIPCTFSGLSSGGRRLGCKICPAVTSVPDHRRYRKLCRSNAIDDDLSQTRVAICRLTSIAVEVAIREFSCEFKIKKLRRACRRDLFSGAESLCWQINAIRSS